MGEQQEQRAAIARRAHARYAGTTTFEATSDVFWLLDALEQAESERDVLDERVDKAVHATIHAELCAHQVALPGPGGLWCEVCNEIIPRVHPTGEGTA